jgi:hypothetical protein
MFSFVKLPTTSLLKIALTAVTVAVLALAAPATLHAAPITYNFTLTGNTVNDISGSGSFTIEGAPVATGISDYTSPSTLDALSFTIGGQTFDLAGGNGNTLVRFLNGQLNNITFAQQVGLTPNRLALMTTGGYVFYYNNLQSASYGTFTSVQVASASPVPEPGSIALLGTGLLGGAATLYRRFAPKRLS